MIDANANEPIIMPYMYDLMFLLSNSLESTDASSKYVIPVGIFNVTRRALKEFIYDNTFI